jgi:signal transduction histidine kinase
MNQENNSRATNPLNADPSLVLHIDDDAANRYAVSKILGRAGYRVISAETGTEGLAILRSERPELVILDIQLPDTNGLELCREIKADPFFRSTPVLQMSANFTKVEDRVSGLESGADGYLAQPIDPSVLGATVRSLFRVRKAEQEARYATQARDDLMAIVSHDLKNPLSAIKVNAQLLEQEASAAERQERKLEPEWALGYAARLIRTSERMERLITDLLDFSRIRFGALPLEPGPCDARKLVRDTSELFRKIAETKGIALEIDDRIGEDTPAVICDHDRVLQVLSNLLGNALKFTPEGGKVTLTADVSPNAELSFSVGDTGPGIDPDHLPKIFDRFWQADRGGRVGTGLGLTIAKGIVDAHGGTIRAESAPGHGSTFHFSIPSCGSSSA